MRCRPSQLIFRFNYLQPLRQTLIVQLGPLQIGFLDGVVEVLEEELKLLRVSVIAYDLLEHGPDPTLRLQ